MNKGKNMGTKNNIALIILLMFTILINLDSYAATVTKVNTHMYEQTKAEISDLQETEKTEQSELHTENEPPNRIYVSKTNKVLTLYVDNKEIGTWECSLGTNTENGNKEVEGDRITPTGDYYICIRNNKSAYHLSLGLSYPDKSDADRGFLQGIITQAQRDAIYSAIDSKRCPPWDTALGGHIMIHGNYHEGVSTAGCIAVSDSVMDILWPYGEIGIKVTIGA